MRHIFKSMATQISKIVEIGVQRTSEILIFFYFELVRRKQSWQMVRMKKKMEWNLNPALLLVHPIEKFKIFWGEYY